MSDLSQDLTRNPQETDSRALNWTKGATLTTGTTALLADSMDRELGELAGI